MCETPKKVKKEELVEPLSAGIIVLIVIGSLLVVCAVIFLGRKFYLKRKGEREKFSEKDVELGRTTTNPLSDWSENYDEATGQKYYVNAKTRRSTWTEPESPDDWTAHTDETSGQTYYLNQKTRRTTWTLPDVLNYTEQDDKHLEDLKSTYSSNAKKKKGKKKKSEKAKKVGIGLLTKIPILVRRTIPIEGAGEAPGQKPDELDEDDEEEPKKQKEKKSIMARASSYFRRSTAVKTDADGNPIKCSECYNDVYLDGLCMHHFKTYHEKMQRANQKRRKKFFGED